MVCFNTVMGTAPNIRDVTEWSFERNKVITLHFSEVFERACAEGVTDLSTLLVLCLSVP